MEMGWLYSLISTSALLWLILVLYNVSMVYGNALRQVTHVLQSWDPTLVNPCMWYHVTCNVDNGVTRIDLGSANLTGQLDSQLGQLTNLQYFRLNNNDMTGTIPYSLTTITTLQVLDLSNNNLRGYVPNNGSFLLFTPNSFANNPKLILPVVVPLPPAPASAPLNS